MIKIKEVVRNIALYFILPISIFILFKGGIDDFLSRLLIKPFLSYCYPASWRFDIASFLIFLVTLIPVFSKIFKRVAIPPKWYYLTATFTFLYLVYRITGDRFVLTSFSFSTKIKLLDLLFCLPALTIFLSFFFRRKKVTIPIDSAGFAVDEAIKLASKDDLLHRQKFIHEIANKIKRTDSKNGSFPIGVVASWGSGKTTFLNTLVTEFQENEYVIIELNVWKCSNANQIVETFFKLLKEKLKAYSFSIDNKLQEYSGNLLKDSKDGVLSSLKYFVENLFPNQSLEKQYDTINEEIKKIDKKIVVLIDDLDRLNKPEIYEVIRLIRNTANFSNTFFVVAYDRNYILNAIEDINPYQSHLFLEKIFQVEFTLPPIPETVIKNELNKRLESFLTDIDKKGYNALQKKGHIYLEYGDADLTRLFIKNMRDVTRFINSLKLSYEFIKNEIFFSDFYNLELIRFKHPELFQEIYRQRYIFFTTESDKNSGYVSTNLYALKFSKEANNTGTKISLLKDFLTQEKTAYKLTLREIEDICTSFSSIFPNSNSLLSSRRKAVNNHLSVLKPSMFDRYFILGIEGMLSEIKFSNMRALPMADFIEALTTIASDEDLIGGVLERFIEIKDFDSKDDFEKIVRGIFHFANLPHPNYDANYKFESINYDGRVLAAVLGDERNAELFDKKQEYKNFLLSLFKTKDVRYTYTNDFVSYLLRDNYYSIEPLFPKQELSNILMDNFKEAINQSEKFAVSLWWHYTRCELRNEKSLGSGSMELKYSIIPEASQIMRHFIFEKDMDGFLVFSIRKTNFEKTYTIEGTLKAAFRKDEIFIWLLKRSKVDSKYKEEFLSFYEALGTNEQYKQKGVPQSFFTKIPHNLIQR